MRHRPPLRLLPVLLAAMLGAGCDGILESRRDTLAESRLTFIRVAPDAPPLGAVEVSFWIVRGQDREVEIRYQNGQYSGKCLLFRVPAAAPLRHADGRPFAAGDSALVTIRVVDAERFVFHFEPGGLRFDPNHPAELEVRYRWMDPDHNGDGVVNAADERIERAFGFWRQERPGEPWTRVATTRLPDALEARARVTGFTIYALAAD
jgi:hypothetical protein